MTKVDSNYKKTEKALYDYKFLKGYIELRKKDLAELDYQGVSATALSLAKSDNKKISDPVGDEFARVDRIRETWGKEIKIKENIISSIDYAISLLDDGERKIVEMKYKKCIRYKDIASFLGYSERQIIRINKRLIEKISIVLFGKD